MSDSPDDRQLIEASLAGETEAFGVLVQRYQDRLYPTLLRLTGSAEDASDLLQDAFLRAFERLDRYQGGSSFYTWIYRIAVNLALSDRRRRRVAARALSIIRAERPEPDRDPSQIDPTLPIERAERENQIQQALNRLSEEHRTIVVLKDLDGLRYEEIAEILQIPIGTVRSRLHRARESLRDHLRTILDEEPARATPSEPR